MNRIAGRAGITLLLVLILIAGLGFFALVYYTCGQDERTAHYQIGCFAHTGGYGTVKYQIHYDLDQLYDNTCRRSHGKGADKNGYLAEIKFIEGRCDEGQGKLKQHQQSSHSPQQGYTGDK